MPVAGTTAITELWAKTKAWFGRKVDSSTTATTISINLKNNAGDTLSTASIASASSTAAGALSADDKTKLDGIDAGANAYVHPSFTANGAAAKKVGNDAQGHVVLGDALTYSDVGAAASDHTHAAYVNQNAFSNVKVGSTTIAADTATDTLEVVAGDNVTLTPDASGDKLTIAATDTVYTHPTHTAKTSGLYKITVDSLGHVSGTAAVAASDLPTVTLAKGGTGATDAPGARTALDVYSKSEVDGLITSGAAFQGTVNAQSAIEGSAYKAGWYWVVATAGTYVGQTCEVGDMIYCITSKGSAYKASDFSVVQNNLTEMTAAEVDAICV